MAQAYLCRCPGLRISEKHLSLSKPNRRLGSHCWTPTFAVLTDKALFAKASIQIWETTEKNKHHFPRGARYTSFTSLKMGTPRTDYKGTYPEEWNKREPILYGTLHELRITYMLTKCCILDAEDISMFGRFQTKLKCLFVVCQFL